MEKAIAGLNLYVTHRADEVEILKEEVAKELKSALSNIKLVDRGVYVQASTLGSLEALLEFLRTSKIPVSLFCNSFFKELTNKTSNFCLAKFVFDESFINGSSVF